MATPVTLPALGESVTEGTITRWLKEVGDDVEVDEPLLEVSTDKVDTEIPSPVAGKLLEIKAEEDETVEVGAELCTIGDEGESGGSDSDDADASDDQTDDSDDDDSDGDDSDGDDGDEDRADVDPDAGSEKADADEDDDEDEDDEDEDEDKKTETETDPPAAKTDEEPAAQETAPSSSDTKPEAKASQKGASGNKGGTPVTLPALGESVTEGTVTRWLKSVGDEVEVDEPLLEVSTDKVDTEIPSPVAGTLLEIKVDEDETVEVGAELATIGSGDAGDDDSDEEAEDEGGSEESADEEESQEEPEPEPEPEEKKEPEEDKPAARSEEKPKDQPKEEPKADSSKDDSGPYVTPLVRKMAAEHGVDLSTVEGSGVGGRIRKQDVLDAAQAQEQQKGEQEPAKQEPAAKEEKGAPAAEPSPLRGKTESMTRLRKVIAKRMVESLQVSAQLTTVVEVDVTAIARLRDSVKEDFASREGVKLSFLPFFAKAAIDALKAHPSLNASIDTEKGEVTYFDHENLSVAVDTEKGLLTPVIKEAGDLSIAGLARKIADVAERTRANKIGPDELSGGTFTLTNTGSRGALFDTPIINQPQVAILGTGTVVKRPVVIDDKNLGETIAVRRMCYLALTYDHRLVDGADAARFLTDVKQRLESGQFEV